MFMGLRGVWPASPIADGLSVVVTAGLITKEMGRLRQLNRQQLPESFTKSSSRSVSQESRIDVQPASSRKASR